jgi:DNA-binding transcriptional LysR family regulator
MNLKHLETFHHFCRYLTVSRTAEHLNVTQPAVSQQLRNFEAECGTKLFHRDHDGYHLTPTGEAVFLLTKRIFSRVSQIERLLADSAEASAERLRIGATKTYARTVMPELIARFQERFPTVQVRVSEGNSTDLIRRVINREEDLAVVARAEYGHALQSIPFARCEFILVARPDHPLAQAKSVSIDALKEAAVILRERGSGSRKAVLEKLARFGVRPSLMLESESLSFILAYVERRLGLAFVLTHEVEHKLLDGSLKRIDLIEGNISLESDIVWLRDEPTPLPITRFIEIVAQTQIRNR